MFQNHELILSSGIQRRGDQYDFKIKTNQYNTDYNLYIFFNNHFCFCRYGKAEKNYSHR